MERYDLTRLPSVRAALRSRWPQFVARSVALAGLLLAILSGLLGTPVGSRNFGIVFVWILWWALLMLAAVPLLGRGWCSVCPIPLPGEWLQQGNLLGPSGPASPGRMKRWLGARRWPRAWRNIWLQNAAFALLALFSAAILTQPRLTGAVLALFMLLAVLVGLVYQRRAFCRYLCPLGGFIGLYSRLAPLEVRVKDPAVCAGHAQKTCYTGNSEGYGCPWLVFPGSLANNANCGLCLECLRTCPYENLAVNLRPPGAELERPARGGMDEAFKACLSLGSAMAYSAVLLGPWGALKSAAYRVGSLPWLGYALAFLLLVFVLLPGAFYLAVAAGQRLADSSLAPRKQFGSLASALIPLGLAAWIAFSLSFLFANFSYLWPAFSDPLGLGWDLIGTAALEWKPYFAGQVPAWQTAFLLGGLFWSSRTAQRIAAERLPAPAAGRQALPVIAFCLLATLALLVLLIG